MRTLPPTDCTLKLDNLHQTPLCAPEYHCLLLPAPQAVLAQGPRTLPRGANSTLRQLPRSSLDRHATRQHCSPCFTRLVWLSFGYEQRQGTRCLRLTWGPLPHVGPLVIRGRQKSSLGANRHAAVRVVIDAAAVADVQPLQAAPGRCCRCAGGAAAAIKQGRERPTVGLQQQPSSRAGTADARCAQASQPGVPAGLPPASHRVDCSVAHSGLAHGPCTPPGGARFRLQAAPGCVFSGMQTKPGAVRSAK